MTVTKRSKDERGLSDAACTPKALADLLFETHGDFDLDPASNPRSHIHARWSFSLETKLDGLKLPWHGSTFVNWPYGDPLPWAFKTREELTSGRCTESVILCKLDCSTEAWAVSTAPIPRNGDTYYPELWLFKDRIQFDEHPELVEIRKREIAEGRRRGPKSGKSSNNFCSAIIHHRLEHPLLNLHSVADPWIRG